MARGRVCAWAGCASGAASIAVCVWSLEALEAVHTVADGRFLRALSIGAPSSLLLAVAGVVAALAGLVRSDGASAIGFLALAVCVAAMALGSVLFLVALGLLLMFV